MIDMIDMIDHGLTMSEEIGCCAVKMYSLVMLQDHVVGYHRMMPTATNKTFEDKL